MGNRKCTAWLSSRTDLLLSLLCTCFMAKYIDDDDDDDDDVIVVCRSARAR